MKVSIIIPCYNQDKYIAHTLTCVKKQTFEDWECIVMDDGSTDNSGAVVKEWAASEHRIKYYYQKNSGVCVARNNAVGYASGEYLLFVDSDDLISNVFVGLCVEQLDADKNVKLVACNYKKFGKYKKSFKVEKYSLPKLMGHNLWGNACMIRREDFIRVGGYNTNMRYGLEDWDLWLKILADGGKVKCLDGFHYFYRIRGHSRNDGTKTKDSLTALRRVIWENHHELYSKVFSSPFESEEYLRVANSYEYKIGKVLFYPVRFLMSLMGL